MWWVAAAKYMFTIMKELKGEKTKILLLYSRIGSDLRQKSEQL